MSIHFPSQTSAVWNVAKKLGIDLPSAIRDDALSPEDLSDLLINCANCWHTSKCGRWQAREETTVPPSFCASKTTLHGLSMRSGDAAPHHKSSKAVVIPYRS